MAKKNIPNMDNNPQGPSEEQKAEKISNLIAVSGMYENWFLDYASYVILERAVPHINDGLKPVQRRILHSLKEMDDGRYNKVANIIGNTMKYHPHGDVSIGDAMVQLGQKDLLIDTQGNWGNVFTGDSAAASRYIEARPSKFALEVAYNAQTTDWQLSYDGRNKEPLTLPMKFPLLLAQGVEGIAVGLACKIMPHNFLELLDACIGILKGHTPDILPDFYTGGMADFSKYNNGLRGGKIRIRAKIEKREKKTLAITEIPFGTTTTSLIDSILSANDKNKIKIKKVEDNTANKVEIVISLHPEASLEKTIDALYAFTDCEVSISPNSCVIKDDRPQFLGVNEILQHSVEHTKGLLGKELQIKLGELTEDWHLSSLEKIFIEKRIYRDIEDCKTWESVIETIDIGLKPYKKKLKREVTREDIINLTEIKIKRISKYDAFRADEHIKGLETQIDEVQNHLAHLKDYTIAYYKNLIKKFGKGRERKTEITTFDTIIATDVAVANQKLYVNREEGFAGYGLKKDEFICECSDIDDIIAFRKDGNFNVFKVSEKVFVGKDIIHIAIFRKNDRKTVYNMIYQDGLKGNVMVKRFFVEGITRDKEYILTKGSPQSKVLHFSVNANGEAEKLTIHLKPKPKLKKLFFDFDFSEVAVKGRASIGNILSRNSVHRISKGKSEAGEKVQKTAALPIMELLSKPLTSEKLEGVKPEAPKNDKETGGSGGTEKIQTKLDF